MPASPGIVIGPVHLLLWEVPEVPHRIVPDEAIPAELNRLHDAIEKAKARLQQVKVRAERHAGSEEAAIFEVQLMILSDGELISSVENLVRQNLSAEKAFDLVLIEWRQNFARHTAASLRERVGDLTDVHIRVLSILLGLPDHDPVDLPKGSNAILVTHDLTPSLTVQLDREAISAIATDAGTRTSHVAILARSLGLPAVVGLRDATTRLTGGQNIILDGSSGVIILDPTSDQVEAYSDRARRELATTAEFQALSLAEPVTLDDRSGRLVDAVDVVRQPCGDDRAAGGEGAIARAGLGPAQFVGRDLIDHLPHVARAVAAEDLGILQQADHELDL